MRSLAKQRELGRDKGKKSGASKADLGITRVSVEIVVNSVL